MGIAQSGGALQNDMNLIWGWCVEMHKATVGRRRSQRIGSASVNAVPDEELLIGYRDTGDRDLFAELVRRYESELYSYLHRYLRDAQMAEDAFQNTFLQVHLKCDQFMTSRRVRPWLYAIATHQAIDSQRRNRRHRTVSLDRLDQDGDSLGRLIELLHSTEPTPSRRASDAENRQWLEEALAMLPDHLRSVVHMVYHQGLKYREVAEALSIPVGTVKSRMHTAILKLNEAWHGTESSTELETDIDA